MTDIPPSCLPTCRSELMIQSRDTRQPTEYSKKGFAGYATRFWHPACVDTSFSVAVPDSWFGRFGFATGWNYLMMWLFLCPNMVCPFPAQSIHHDRVAPSRSMLHELSFTGGQTKSHRMHGWPPSSYSVRQFVLLYLSLFSNRSLIVVSVNCLGIRVFGELEFWFASIKVTTLIGLIIFGITVGQLVSFKTDTFFLSYPSSRSRRQPIW